MLFILEDSLSACCFIHVGDGPCHIKGDVAWNNIVKNLLQNYMNNISRFSKVFPVHHCHVVDRIPRGNYRHVCHWLEYDPTPVLLCGYFTPLSWTKMLGTALGSQSICVVFLSTWPWLGRGAYLERAASDDAQVIAVLTWDTRTANTLRKDFVASRDSGRQNLGYGFCSGSVARSPVTYLTR